MCLGSIRRATGSCIYPSMPLPTPSSVFFRFDSIRGAAHTLLQRSGGAGDVRVLIWGDSLSGQLMTALRCMAPIPGLVVDFQRDDMLRHALSWADEDDPARAVLAGCGGDLDGCLRRTFVLLPWALLLTLCDHIPHVLRSPVLR